MKVYITKYALSEGIHASEGNDTYCGLGRIRADHGGLTKYFSTEEWFEDFTSAKARAEEMRSAKIVNLEKQIAKLRAMTFEEPK
jgi:hypothetical protein